MLTDLFIIVAAVGLNFVGIILMSMVAEKLIQFFTRCDEE